MLSEHCVIADRTFKLSTVFSARKIAMTWSDPFAALSFKAAKVYLFVGLVPGLFAYSGYSYFGTAFGALSTSLSMYLGPVIGAALSITFLGEAPTIVHLIGGVLSLGGMWLSLRRKSEGK